MPIDPFDDANAAYVRDLYRDERPLNASQYRWAAELAYQALSHAGLASLLVRLERLEGLLKEVELINYALNLVALVPNGWPARRDAALGDGEVGGG